MYGFINGHPEYSVARWARYFQVSRAGYYAHMGVREEREAEKTSYKKWIKRIFDESGGTYGPDRMRDNAPRGTEGVIRKDQRIYGGDEHEVNPHTASDTQSDGQPESTGSGISEPGEGASVSDRPVGDKQVASAIRKDGEIGG